jgi:hypothetical protein
MAAAHPILEAMFLSALLGLGIAVVAANVSYWRRRRKMTRHERAIQDADLRNSGDW